MFFYVGFRFGRHLDAGGIAWPPVFILGPDRIVRFVSVDEVVSRVPAAEILRLLQSPGNAQMLTRKRLLPSPAT